MGKCKNCANFKLGEDKKTGKCFSEKIIYAGEMLHNQDVSDCLVYYDAGLWDYESKVGINFGCIHYTKKGGGYER